jgi:predicted Zn-dependent peptidase
MIQTNRNPLSAEMAQPEEPGNGAAPAPPLREADVLQLHRTRLENGLRLWCKPRPGTGTVALMLQIPVGSRHETRQNNGVSHFLEHLVFTGTGRWDENEVTEVIRRRGGEVNARTGAEDTVFHLHLKADDLEVGLDWLAEVVFNPTLSEAKFGKERDVIVQEKGGRWGRFKTFMDWVEDHGLGWNVFRAVRHRLFPESSLLLPVIGDDASLNGITREALVEFYRRHYVAANMTLVVVGDVQPGEVEAKARQYFGQHPAGERPGRPTTPPSPAGGFNLRLSGPNINEQGQVLLGAPLPGLGSPDRFPLGVLAEMLDTALTRDIRHQRGLVYGIDVYPALYTDVGYFVVYTTADSDKFPEILAEVEGQIDRAIAGEIDAEKVEEAKTGIRGRALLAMEGNLNLAWWLTEDALYTPDDQPVPDFFAGVAGVTPADIRRVAGQYLARSKRYQAIHRPGLTPARLRPALIAGAAGILAGGLWLLWLRRRTPRNSDN